MKGPLETRKRFKRRARINQEREAKERRPVRALLHRRETNAKDEYGHEQQQRGKITSQNQFRKRDRKAIRFFRPSGPSRSRYVVFPRPLSQREWVGKVRGRAQEGPDQAVRQHIPSQTGIRDMQVNRVL